MNHNSTADDIRNRVIHFVLEHSVLYATGIVYSIVYV
jgi:hypothetical protein